MKIFTLSKQYTIVCNWKKTRNGFKHTASLCSNGQEIYDTKICYLNRTWEKYQYQSILKKTIENNFEDKEKTKYLKIIENDTNNTNHTFKTVKTVCSLGEIFCKDRKEKNKWDKRMINTIPGISFPDDWDKLSEKEKKRRLDKVKNTLTEKKED